METTHGRKQKSKTEFKAVLNKVLVSGLVLATVLGSTTPAFAVNSVSTLSPNGNVISVAYEKGVSVESSIQNIRNTIATIKDMVSKGSVSDITLKELATQLYALETAVRSSGDNNWSVDVVLSEAETVLNSMGNTASVSSTTTAYSALVAVKTSLEGIGTVTVENHKAPNVTSFLDVKTSDWFFKAVDACRERGAISGKKVYEDNTALYAPQDTVTRAEFLKIAIGVCLGENAPANGEGSNWWGPTYDYALNNGIIESTYYARTDMVKSISRYEMAEIINNCADILLKEGTPDVSLARQLADYDKVGNTRFKTDVYRTFARGIIQGKPGGYYDGVSTGTRAEAAQMLATMMNYIQRSDPSSKPVFNERDGSTTAAPTARTLRWDDPSRP